MRDGADMDHTAKLPERYARVLLQMLRAGFMLSAGDLRGGDWGFHFQSEDDLCSPRPQKCLIVTRLSTRVLSRWAVLLSKVIVGFVLPPAPCRR